MTSEETRAVIWAKELAIYQARGRGDLHTYLACVSDSYLAWPPHRPAPMNAAALRRQAAGFASTGQEQLEMTLTDFSLDGDTAVIYYATHRTILPDGTPADERFEVIHVWLQRENEWRLCAGMARAMPLRPKA